MQLLHLLAAVFVLCGIASALAIAIDQRTCRQPMRIMNSVWVLTGLWASFFGLWAYYAFGRPPRCREWTTEGPDSHVPGSRSAESSAPPMPGLNDMHREETAVIVEQEAGARQLPHEHTPDGRTEGVLHEMQSERMHKTGMSDMRTQDMQMPSMQAHDRSMPGMQMQEMTMPGAEMPGTQMSGTDTHGMEMPGMRMPVRPRWQSTVLSTLHCGAGCTLADLVGEWFLYLVPVAIGGSLLAGSWVIDYLLALVFGIGFQYAAIRGMEPATPRSAVLRRAAKADILSLTAWQAGMYGWMALVIFVFRDGQMLPRTSWMFWFMMQIAMACGFLLSLPVNVLLIRKGIKHGM